MKPLKKTLISLTSLIVLVITVIVIFPNILKPENNVYLVIFGVVVILLFVEIIFSRKRALTENKPTTDTLEYPYHLRDDFLSPAEQSFYLTLRHTVSDWALICPKVSLGDLFFVKSSDPSKYRSYTNRIDRKHVDFLLCDLNTVRPLLGIELDDKSHKRNNRQIRDENVDNVFSAANLPLVRIPVRSSYSTSDLDSILRQHVPSIMGKTPNQVMTIENESVPPLCPKCGSEMVLREAKRGSNKGEQFWGCPNYPRCRGIVTIKKPQ